MNSFLLTFQDKAIEQTYKNNLKFANLFNFHYILIIEISLFLTIAFIVSIINAFTILRIIFIFISIMLIIINIILAKRLKNSKYLIQIQVLIHITIIAFLVELVNQNNAVEKINEIMGVPIHLSFFCILLTRLNWFLCAIFYFFFNIFYVLRLFTVEKIENEPIIIVLHIMCVIGFSFLVFYQEKTIRIFYKMLYESNQNTLQFQLLLKNIIPAPIFIADFENKKIEFFNNSALDIINGLNNEFMQTLQEESCFIERNDSSIEKVINLKF